MTSPAEALKKAWVEQLFAALVAQRQERIALHFETLLDAVIAVSKEASEWDGTCRRSAETLLGCLREIEDAAKRAGPPNPKA